MPVWCFINAYASESFDREDLADEFSDNLVSNVAKNCSNTVVVIHSAGKPSSSSLHSPFYQKANPNKVKGIRTVDP